MCRFFVYWGVKPASLERWILQADNCLLQQSQCDVSQRPNADGWGFAWRDNGKIHLIKSARSAFEDEAYRSASQKLEGDLLFAHVRRRSQGPISVENSHPFVHENWIFMHNGNIPNFEQYKHILRHRISPRVTIDTSGTTDSEFLFKHFVYWFQKAPRCDLSCVHNLICRIIDELIENTGPAIQDQLALNFILSNGEFLVGFRRNRSLFYCETDNALLVSSEKIDSRLPWNEVPENYFILAENPAKIELKRYIYDQA